MTVVLFGCARGDSPQPDTTARRLIPLDTVESVGALAVRREAQASFDAAREALAQQRFADAQAGLVDAVTFFQTEARVAEADARPALERTARELDGLVRKVARGDMKAPALLDRTFARAHAAEALLHLVRANAAMFRQEDVRAGEELLMSIDHTERAAKDARLQSDSAIQAAVADARSLAIEMAKGMEAVPDEAAKVTDEIERAIDRIVSSTRESTP